MTALAERLATIQELLRTTTGDLYNGGDTAELPPVLGPITGHDLGVAIDYLHDLIEHGWNVAALVERAVGDVGPDHPVRVAGECGTLETALGHSKNLLEVAQAITCDAAFRLRKVGGGPS